MVGGGPEYAESVVVRALEFRGKASSAARIALDRALDSGVRVNGFRDASKAPSGPLKTPTLEALVEECSTLLQALLDVWAESMPELLGAVSEHLVKNGGAPNSPDWDGRPWSAGELEDAVDALLAQREDLCEPDLRVMLCLVSGRCVRVDDPAAGINSPFLLETLDALHAMDPKAPDWQDVPRFVDAVKELDATRAKRAADAALSALEARAKKALEEHAEELAYLDLRSQVSVWAEEATSKVWLIDEAVKVVDELLERLKEYSPIRPQAGTRAEEAERAQQRLVAEDGIMEVAAKWRGLMDRPVPVDEPDRGWGDVEDDDSRESGDAQLMAKVDELSAEVERLRRADAERLVEYESVAKARADLEAERDALRVEVARLGDELSASRETVEIWRRAGISERLADAGLRAEERPEPRTVRDAVALAQKLFSDRLVIALNSKSDKRSPFQKPQEVFDALEWLAVDYHYRRANPGGSPDFDKLLKEACPGWSYKASQTEITREQFEQWYTTIWEEKTYDLSPHLGKGTSYDPQNTIRIAFAWDDGRRRVVVGYIGMHQRNRKS